MPTISVRISDDQKKALLEYGPLSSSIRDALRLYLDAKRSERLLLRLRELQGEDRVRTTSVEDARDGTRYLMIFHGLLETNKIRVVRPSLGLMERSYALAARNGLPIYDAVFIALALEVGAALKTYDRRQAAVMRKESAR